MTAEDKKLFARQESIRHFLFSSSDPAHLKAAAPAAGKALRSSFPQMPAGELFIAEVRQQMEAADRFAALAARLDAPRQDEAGSGQGRLSGGQLELAAALDEICRREKGLWGLLDSGLLAAFFAHKNDSQGLDLARGIQRRLSRAGRWTATMGVAGFPTLAYPRHAIILNACKALEHAAFFGPGSIAAFDAVSLNISGDKLYENGDIEGAVGEFKKALELDAANVNVHNSLGVCYALQEQYGRAMNEFKTAVRLDGREYMALYNMGLTSKLTGHRRQALDFFLQAAQINGSVFEIVFQAAKLYLELQEPEKAVPLLEKAAELEPKSGAVFRDLGRCHEALDHRQAAITAYTRAVKHNPRDAQAMSALGHLFAEQGENPEIALLFCRESVSLDPEDGLLRYRLGRLYYHQNRPDKALKEFKKAQHLGYDASGEISEIENNRKAAK